MGRRYARLKSKAEADDVVLAIFTSGTIGKLKAVQHTHASYVGIVLNIFLNLPDIRRGDIMLYAASLIHADRPRRRFSSRICARRTMSGNAPKRGCWPAAARARIAKSGSWMLKAATCRRVRAARSRCARRFR
jgi:acyl-coenzyme A synthetase/AMP-(fatty) acid ligase